MDQFTTPINNYSPSFSSRIKDWLFRWIRLTSRPTVRVYHGYGTLQQMVVFGHVLKVSPLSRKKYRKNIWTNTFALIRLFMVQPFPLAKVQLHFNGMVLEGATEKDGFFRFQWQPDFLPDPGWHQVEVHLIKATGEKHFLHATGKGEIYIPHQNNYGIISDIDDTFLISHSSNLRKRLFVLLTENAHSRKPFEGVVNHYRYLAHAGTSAAELNPFFYVSSSEWNLYDYIREFSQKNELPKGIYLLNQLKLLSQAWKTGQNNHATKFMRISRVLEAFPEQQFVLLGDDSQQDPVIYAAIAEHFTNQIKAIYLRNVFEKNMVTVKLSIEKMMAAGVPVCHFKHSSDAILHSMKIGLIVQE